MRLICRIEVKNDWVVKGFQYEGVRKIKQLEESFSIPRFNGIEEIFLVDLTRSIFGLPPNFLALEKIAHNCLLPITFGGGINTLEDALRAIELGASKVYINTAATGGSSLISKISSVMGQQAIVAGCEYRTVNNRRVCYSESGREPLGETLSERIKEVINLGAGEVLVSSIDLDGTKKGLDLGVLDDLVQIEKPVILSGGGTSEDLKNRDNFTGCEGVCFSSVFIEYYD